MVEMIIMMVMMVIFYVDDGNFGDDEKLTKA